MKKTLLTGVFFLSLIIVNAQMLYGVTSGGGSGEQGIIFSYDVKSKIYSIKRNFDSNKNAEGLTPRGSLTKTTDGKLYGTSYLGGANNFGTLFEYDPSQNAYSVKVNFSITNGTKPFGSVMQASNGKLYGMTSSGGAYNSGTLFEYDPTNQLYTVKVTFDGSNGKEAQGGLIQASNGKLYGMTYLSSAGNENRGVLFEFDPVTSAYIVKVEFNGNNGSRPYGDLTEKNGKLYGMTREGGASGFGTLFEFNPSTGILTKKLDFGGAGAKGKNPKGTLCLTSNGKFYGTVLGGSSGNGLIFEYDAEANIYTPKADFDSENGKNPMGSLMQASDGKLYGLSSYGGTPELGTMFSYDIATKEITSLITFEGANGGNPFYTKLVETARGDLGIEELNADHVKLYPNPVENILYLKGVGNATVSIYSVTGQKMLSKNVTDGQVTVKSLVNGVYIVKIEKDGKVSSHKILKK